MKIVIIDYGLGNVRSIYSAFKSQGIEPVLSNDSEVIFNADGIVLPGVGAYAHAMKNLKKLNLVKILKNYAKTEKPILGICLGMQLLMEESEEFGITKGLGLIKGRVVKMPISNTFQTKLPNINWLAIKPNVLKWEKTILKNISLNSEMYFIHSYVAKLDNEDEVLSVTDFHNVIFCSALKKGNIYGCQFHPEKSSQLGLKIIKNFIKICK